jgi:undecaprenyl-diphosphatase
MHRDTHDARPSLARLLPGGGAMPSPKLRRRAPDHTAARHAGHAPGITEHALDRARDRASAAHDALAGAYHSRRWRMIATAAGGTVAAALFATLTARVQGGWATPFDRGVRRSTWRGFRGPRRSRRGAARRGATAVGALGDTMAYVPAAAVGSYLLRRSGAAGGGAVFGAAATVALGRHVFRWFVPRFRPPTHLWQSNAFASFPSGHATGMTAVGLTAAHVLAHEGLVPPLPALAGALALSAAVGAARVATDDHWATDIVGGWLAGAAVASAATLAYEARRLRHHS